MFQLSVSLLVKLIARRTGPPFWSGSGVPPIVVALAIVCLCEPGCAWASHVYIIRACGGVNRGEEERAVGSFINSGLASVKTCALG